MLKKMKVQDSMREFEIVDDSPYYIKPTFPKAMVNKDSSPIRLNKVKNPSTFNEQSEWILKVFKTGYK